MNTTMKVKNIIGRKGNAVKNQFVLSEAGNGANGNFVRKEIFQSYDSVICERILWADGKVYTMLDATYWDYSTTTGKYRNLFLGETKVETAKKIADGTYRLANLN